MLITKYQIVNRKSFVAPNPTPPSHETPEARQDCPPSTKPPIPPKTGHELARHVVWRVTGHEPPQSSTSVENPLQISPFYAKRTQFPKHPKSTQTQSPQRITKIQRLRQDPKTNPNEPKRTQNEPNFSLVRGSQSQNEPKQSQNEPKQTQSPKNPKINATSLSTKAYENKDPFRLGKANPNKPNFKLFAGDVVRRKLCSVTI